MGLFSAIKASQEIQKSETQTDAETLIQSARNLEMPGAPIETGTP